MMTPLVMFALMVGPWLVARWHAAWRGLPASTAPTWAAVGLGLLFLFTASGHFVRTDDMVLMLPAWVPGRAPLVYLSGVIEVVIAIGFFVPATRRLAGVAAITVLIAFFPANVYAAIEHVPMGGHAWGPGYLWIRAPLQLAILVWVYRFTLRPSSGARLVDHRQRLFKL
jgi:uncharacterized membrane protein